MNSAKKKKKIKKLPFTTGADWLSMRPEQRLS